MHRTLSGSTMRQASSTSMAGGSKSRGAVDALDRDKEAIMVDPAFKVELQRTLSQPQNFGNKWSG
jgi:hypothetical protein